MVMKIADYRGISTPLSEINAKIEEQGWEKLKVQFKKDEYQASATNQHGEKMEATGQSPQTAAGKLLSQIMRHNMIRMPPPIAKTATWQITWEHQAKEIAQAYLKAPDFEQKAGTAWKDLGDDSLKRADMVGRYLDIEVVNDPEPYPEFDDLTKDVKKRRKLKVTNQMLDHPIWSGDQVLAFRIAFDVLGHVASNGDFTWGGQNLAVAEYMPNLSEIAQSALFGEVIARAAYTTLYRGFAPHKIALFPDFISDRQQANQGPSYRGIHPAMSIPPGETPTVASKTSNAASRFFTSPEQHQRSLQDYLTYGVPQESGERIPLHEHHRQVEQLSRTADWKDYTVKQGDLEPGRERLIKTWESTPGFVYHATHADNMADIARDGLLPHNHPDNVEGQNWSISEPNSVYMASDADTASTFAPQRHVGMVRVPQSSLALTPDPYTDNAHVHQGPISPNLLEFFNPSSKQWLNSSDAIKTFDPEEGEVFSKVTQAEPEMADPNRDWESGYEPQTREQNVYLNGGDPLDKQGTADTASQLHSGWQDPDENGELDHEKIKHAVVQAFRAALLSPNKGLDDNAVQYHAVKHLPQASGDPQPMADALEADKTNWNNQLSAMQEQESQQVQQQMPQQPMQPMPQEQPQQMPQEAPGQAFAKVGALKNEDAQKWLQYVKHHRPDLGDDQIHDYAKRRLRNMRIDEEYRVLDENPEMHASDVRDKVNKTLEKRLKAILKPSKAKDDTDVKMGKGTTPDDYGHLYAGWIDGSLDSIAQIEAHADELADAAEEDIKAHDGGGWHFRKTALDIATQNKIKGVAPKTVSFAWLLLAPMTSQIAALDTHMAKWLGQKEMPSGGRDYFKAERQLTAARDQLGYKDMPLGQFQWALWDHKRNGPGMHQDHSMLRPLSPTDPSAVQFHPELSMPQGMADQWYDQAAPAWWKQTEDARNQVGAAWDSHIKPQFPADSKNINAKWPQGSWPWMPRTPQDQSQNQNQDPNYWINPDAPLPIESKVAGGDELHLGVEVPHETKNQIANWASQMQWPEDSQLEDPSGYHLTMMYAPNGYNKHNEWAQSEPSRNPLVRPAGQPELLPAASSNYNYAVTLPVYSPELDDWRQDVQQHAAERGIDPVQYPGGHKNHITVGYANEAPGFTDAGVDPFHAGDLSVSQPRQALSKLAVRGIAHWWDLRKPLGAEDAKWLAHMVSVGSGRATKEEAEDFIDDHKDDIIGPVSEFKEKFFDTYDTDRSFRGGSRMSLFRRENLSTEEVWATT